MITPQERRELIAKLEEHRKALLEEVSKRNDKEMQGRHKEGDRTFKAMLAHVASTEWSYVNNWARRARDEGEPDVGWPSTGGGGGDPMFEEATKVDVAELLSQMQAARENTLRFTAETADGEFDRKALNSPFGDLTVYQFLKSLYRHDQMHLDEIRGQESQYVVVTRSGQRL